MPGMQTIIGIRTLRRQVTQSLVRVSRGETILVVRNGHPIAIIRPIADEETGRQVSVTTFRRNLRRTLAVTRRRPIVLTWYGAATAVVAPVPRHLEPDNEEESA